MKRAIPFLIILMGLSTLSVKAQKTITLKLNPNKGDNYTVVTKNSTMNLMEVQGQSMTSTQTIETRQSLTVADANDNEITFEGKTETMKLTVSQMGMTLTYDSEHPENTSPMLAGQVEEISEGLNKTFTSKYNTMGIGISDEADEEEASLGKASNAILQLSEGPVSVGTTWTSKKSQSLSGIKIEATMNYEVTKISKKAVEIALNGTVDGDSETSGTYTGTITINPQTGMIIKSVIKPNISFTLSEQGLSIPITMTGTSTITVE
mgnify:CR=1 FL=1